MNINTIYLLTGAAGFLGINICTQLIERGEHIRAFVLKGDPARKYLPAEVEVFEGDLCSAEDCEAFFNIPEGSQSVCIHCASMVTIDPGYSEKLIAVNVGGTENSLPPPSTTRSAGSSCTFPPPVPSPNCLPDSPSGK